MKETNIIHIAIDNLEKITGFQTTWKDTDKGFFDGMLSIQINGKKLVFEAEVRKELRFHQINLRIKNKTIGKPLIIIAGKIFPSIKEFLRKNNIAYLEANGNVFIKHENLYLWIEGNEPVQTQKEKTNRAFTKTGLKTVFHFLLKEELVNDTHREIANTVGIGLGNINYVIHGLKELGFLVKLSKNQYKLTDKNKLLEKWIEVYKEKLQPDLEMGKFRFVKEEDFVNWKNIPFKGEKTLWGGEPAGDLLTNHLRPEELTIYTTETRQELMKRYRLIPDDKGYIKIYRKFWNIGEGKMNVVPPILVYTDLINKNNQRCTETANLIYNEFIKNHL